MIRILTLAYGAVSYASFLLAFLYAIGFVGNVVVPKSLDSPATDPWPTALAIDLGLLSLFALQHSVMARQGFKRSPDQGHPCGCRAQHLRAGQQPGALPAVLAVAAARRRRLGGPARSRPRAAATAASPSGGRSSLSPRS